VRYTLRLDSGQQPEAAWRAMSSARAAGARLRYQLFRDPGRREVWGDGAGNAFLHVGLGSGGTQRVRVFGRIPPRQPVPAGTYADTITLTVEW
jgi:spore coat protein U-like protein